MPSSAGIALKAVDLKKLNALIKKDDCSEERFGYSGDDFARKDFS